METDDEEGGTTSAGQQNTDDNTTANENREDAGANQNAELFPPSSNTSANSIEESPQAPYNTDANGSGKALEGTTPRENTPNENPNQISTGKHSALKPEIDPADNLLILTKL